MCGPTNLPSRNRERKRVVVSGAGPAGLLLSSLLLNKNKDAECGVTYDVTLLDGREDYAGFTKQELVENHRSWMLGLAEHGMDAIKALPGLYEDYIKGEGILVREFNIYLGKKKISQTVDPDKYGEGQPPEGYIVDRNFVVAALARYLKDTHENDPHYTSRYRTTCQYVDYGNKRVLVRNVDTGDEEYLPYDLLVGCDGVRSTVREALIKRHSDFSCDIADIFQEYKSVHVDLPPGVSASSMCLLPDVFPNCMGIGLPETGGQVNISVGVVRSNFDKMADELKSDDYRVVADYLRKNFKPFELVDYEDFAKQWVGQRWNQTGMVHCNFYHSLKAGVVIMGDAAHATSPSIGMGMNTALRDAQVFSAILEETGDDFERALPAFSKARVKEGNSLSDLAFHLYCLDTKQQFIETLHGLVRGFLYSKLPAGWVLEHPGTMVGRRGVALSEVYDQAVRVGIMNKHRAINDRIRMRHFEQQSGMVQASTNQGGSAVTKVVVFGAALAAFAAWGYQHVC